MDLMLAHATEPPPSFRDLELSHLIPSSVEQVVMNCLAKDPKDRPQSARDLAECLETALSIGEMGVDDDPVSEDTHSTAPLMVYDPNTLSFQMEAWMPESIAIVKLKGFSHDYDGEIVESVPGLIRVRVGGGSGRGGLAWLGINRRFGPMWVELHLHQIDPLRGNRLFIQVLFRPQYASQLKDSAWRERCTQMFIELRAYLMGTSE
jgi:serine/threonine-protein kinase